MEDKLEAQIKNVMSAIFDIPTNQIGDDASSDTIESWDSLKHMNLIVGLEEEFDIEFNDEDIGSLLNLKLIKLFVEEMVTI
jgi:acyl carrier protein